MPVICVDGIVTRYANYRESDRILSIFTIDHGRMDVKARGCRKPQSPLVNVCQPFVFGQFEIFTGKERSTINACEIKETFYPIREDYERFTIGSVMLRLTHDAAMEDEPNEALFSLLYHALSFLSYGTSDPKDLLCCFLVRYLNATGYRPAITTCAQCGRDIRSDAVVRFIPRGGAACTACSQYGEPISKTALEGLRRMLVMEDSDMDRVKLAESVRKEILHHLSAYTSASLEYGMRALSILETNLSPSITPDQIGGEDDGA
ncbi:MAG TPA: DNA repair protein RecO [Feifaniaceae bacterium]|nr:DNA repair protein RecO [Feifaniaceae bacterium]